MPDETAAYAVPGQEFSVSVGVYNPSGNRLALSRVWLEAPEGETWTLRPESPVPSSVASGQAMEHVFAVRVPENAAATRPYFQRPDNERP